MTGSSLTDSQRETLACFAGGTPLTTTEVADRLDLGRRSTYERLDRLADGDRLATKKVGASARVWWVPQLSREGERTDTPSATTSPTDSDSATASDSDTDSVTEANDISVDARDFTERVDRERELERYEAIVETVNDGLYAVDGDGHFVMVNDGYCDLTGYDRAELLGAHASTVYDESLTSTVRRLAAAVERGDREGASIELDVRRKDGETVPCETWFAPFPLGEETGRCGVVRDVSDRLDREAALVRRREQLAAMNSLNRVVREITDAVVDQSTRAEIEATVCERLAAADSYSFAWIGEVDVRSQTVQLRAEAGVEGYLDDVTIAVDPADPRSEGPTGRAVRTREVQTTHDALADDSFDPWRDHVEHHEFRSSAAVPIVHEDSLYGVLNVYADRSAAFEGTERDVIAQLGEVVGHTIAASDRKRALLSDDVVELEFHAGDVFDAVGIEADSGETVSFDRLVPLEDEGYLAYGSATPDAVGTVRSIAEARASWESVRFYDGEAESGNDADGGHDAGDGADGGHDAGDGADGVQDTANGDASVGFELRLSSPPVVSRLAALGGAIERAVIDGSDYQLTVQVPSGTEVRQVIEAVREAYPDADLQRRRQVTRGERASTAGDAGPVGELTDRQRAALEAAHHTGFFEWPRERSGEEVADSLGVSSPTFHQHLRKAEKAVFEALLS